MVLYHTAPSVSVHGLHPVSPDPPILHSILQRLDVWEPNWRAAREETRHVRSLGWVIAAYPSPQHESYGYAVFVAIYFRRGGGGGGVGHR